MGERQGGWHPPALSPAHSPAPAPPPPPPPLAGTTGRRRWPAECYWPPGVPRTALTLHLAAVAMLALSQLAVAVLVWGASEQRSLLAATTVAKAAVAALVFMRPAVYWQYR